MTSYSNNGKKWQYNISRMVDGKYKPIRRSGFDTKKEASIAAAQVKASLAQGTYGIKKE